jgi:hypothetical protein
MMHDKINLAEKLALFTDHWSPRTVGTFNGHDLMVVRVEGEFTWHSHPDTDHPGTRRALCRPERRRAPPGRPPRRGQIAADRA